MTLTDLAELYDERRRVVATSGLSIEEFHLRRFELGEHA